MNHKYILILYSIAKKDFISEIRYPLGFIFPIIIPFFNMFPLLIWGKILSSEHNVSILSINSILWFFMSQIIWTFGLAISSERQIGTLTEIMLSPIGFLTILFGKSINALCKSFIIFFSLLIFISSYYNFYFNWFLIIILLFISSFLFISLGIVFAGLTITIKHINAFIQIIFVFILLFSCVSQPITIFSEKIQKIIYFNPIYKITNLLQKIIFNNTENVTFDFVYIFIFAFLFMFIGVVIFRILTKKALKNGRNIYVY